MSDVLYDEWDRAYEAGREAGRKEAWSGDYDYRRLMEESRERALRDAITVLEALPDDSCGCLGGYTVSVVAVEAIEALGEGR